MSSLLDSIDDVANIVWSHAATLNPLAWDPTASVVLVVVLVVVVVVACSSKFVVPSASSSSTNIDADLLASSVARFAAPRRLFD